MQKKLPLINSAHGSETRNIINELIKLFNGMGYTYDEALRKAQKVLTEAQETNDMNKDVQSQVDQFISEFESTGETNLEVVQARGNEDLLYKRFEKNEEKLSETKEKVNLKSRILKPIVTIIDDDGYTEVLTKLKPLLDSKGVKADLAIPTSFIGNSGRLTEAQIKSLYDEGWGIGSHTHTHLNLGTLTETALRSELSQSKDILEGIGVNPTHIVYPYNATNDFVSKVTRQYYDFAFGKNYKFYLNTPPIFSGELTRRDLGYSAQTDSPEPGLEHGTLEQAKWYVDKAIEETGWMVFVTHVGQTTESQMQMISDLIDYIQSKKVDILTVDEAQKTFSNLYEDGAGKLPATVDITNGRNAMNLVGANGKRFSTAEMISRKGDKTKLKADTAIHGYDYGVTYTTYNTSDNTGLPSAHAGILVTIKTTAEERHNYQEWHPLDMRIIYKRTWDKFNNKWSDFSQVGQFGSGVFYAGGEFSNTANHTPVNLENRGMIVNHISNAMAVSANLPEADSGQGGTFITVSPQSSTAYNKQIYITHSSNNMYVRSMSGSGSWGDFKGFIYAHENSPISQVSVSFPVVPAKSQSEGKITVQGVTNNDLVVVNPKAPLQSGLLYNAYISNENEVRIRLINVTDSSVTQPTINWIVKVIKS